METAEIAIVGAGPCGLSLAALLESRGVTSYVVYERSDREVAPRGHCLDLHTGSGQKVFREIGAFDDMAKSGRWGEATVHIIATHKLERLFEFGRGRDAPEVDRADIRRILLSRIPDHKVRFRAGVEHAERDDSGKIVLTLSNGTKATGFKLVVGADGVWSKIRPLVTPVKPLYTGHTIFATRVPPSNPHYTTTKSVVTAGNIAICGLGNLIWSAPNARSVYELDLTIKVPADFPANTGIDLSTDDANKEFFLKDEYFGQFAPEIQDIIRHSEGDWRPWKLYQIPSDSFNWSAQADVTLVGDAAHAATPWAGDGVNCAMRDALILARTLQELGVTKKAVSVYEKEMFHFAQDLITKCEVLGAKFLAEDNPHSIVAFMNSPDGSDIVGGTDEL